MKSALRKLFPKNELDQLFLLHSMHFWPALLGEISFFLHYKEVPFGLPVFLALYGFSRKTLKSWC